MVASYCYLMICRCAFARAYSSLEWRANKRNLSDVTWQQAVAICRANPSVCNEFNMLTLFLLFFKLISSSDVWMAKMMRRWGCTQWRSVLIKNDMKQKEKLLDEGVLLMTGSGAGGERIEINAKLMLTLHLSILLTYSYLFSLFFLHFFRSLKFVILYCCYAKIFCQHLFA